MVEIYKKILLIFNLQNNFEKELRLSFLIEQCFTKYHNRLCSGKKKPTSEVGIRNIRLTMTQLTDVNSRLRSE